MREEVWGRPAVQDLRSLRYLVESESLTRQDGLDFFGKVDVRWRMLPGAHWHVLSLARSCKTFQPALIGRPAGLCQTNTPEQAAFRNFCSQRFTLYK
jgi:hypothetical protein